MRATARRCYCNVAKCNTSAIGIRKCCTVLKTADYQRDDLVLYMALLFMMWNIFNAMFLQYIHIQYIFFIHFYLPSTQYTYVHISLSFDSVTCRSFSEIMSDYVIYICIQCLQSNLLACLWLWRGQRALCAYVMWHTMRGDQPVINRKWLRSSCSLFFVYIHFRRFFICF